MPKKKNKTARRAWEDASSMADTETEACPTPTHSTFSEATVKSQDSLDSLDSLDSQDPPSAIRKHVEHHPMANETFMIRSQKEPDKIITLVNGALQVVDGYQPGGGWQWQCIKRLGWYGFRNTVSGTFIGHNGRQQFIADVSHHKAHEYFMAERHEDGGYVLLMRHGDELWEMAIGGDGKTLVERKERGTAWDFVNVDLIEDFHYLPSQ